MGNIQRQTFIDVLKKDVGVEDTGELAACIDHIGWRMRAKAWLRPP